jgi:hypothetical protein
MAPKVADKNTLARSSAKTVIADSSERVASLRSKLVGNFPHIKPLPAPDGPRLLNKKVQRELLALMRLD